MSSVYYTMACITPRMNKAVCRRRGETLNFIFAEIKKNIIRDAFALIIIYEGCFYCGLFACLFLPDGELRSLWK